MRRLPRLDAIEEVAGVADELVAHAAGVVAQGLRPVTGRRVLGPGGAADRRRAGELGHSAGRVDLPVRRHHEAAPRDRQAALLAEELEPGAGLAAAGFAVRPNRRPTAEV